MQSPARTGIMLLVTAVDVGALVLAVVHLPSENSPDTTQGAAQLPALMLCGGRLSRSRQNMGTGRAPRMRG